jgi:glycosyltransferase involved in cell wall biosynthesis
MTSVAVTLEQRFVRSRTGVWTTSGFHAGFWARYRRVFDAVTVVARTSGTETVSDGCSRVDGDGITVVDLPDYRGLTGYLRSRQRIVRTLRDVVGTSDAVIPRLPSPIGMLAIAQLRRARRPYAVEVVGDPHDVFAPGAVRHPCRALLRQVLPFQLRQACADAAAAAYVTRHALQRRYPCGRHAAGASDADLHRAAPSWTGDGLARHPFTTFYSSVELGDDAFRAEPRQVSDGSVHLVTVGTLEQLYKGQDVLMKAVSRCRDAGANLRLTFVGDGRYRAALEGLRDALCLTDRVRFTGHVAPASAVRRELDRADLFVLPSRTEGLPRALLEAMARGLPAIGTKVGGVPELLPPEDLVPPDDVPRLADKILEFYRLPSRRQAAGLRNLIEARQYRDDVLVRRRDEFYTYVRQMADETRRAAR